jgi:predicted neutral ceramidase superfamily lipid hydrolase
MVQRPSWLIAFKSRGQEEAKFIWQTVFEYQTQNILFTFMQVCVVACLLCVYTNKEAQGQNLLLQFLWLIPFAIVNFVLIIQNFQLNEKRMSLLKWSFIAVDLVFLAFIVTAALRDATNLNFSGLTQLVMLTIILTFG